MPVHRIEMSQPSKTVLHRDVTFEIFSGNVKLGEMKISKGNLEWTSRSHQKSKRITWERLADLLDGEYGR
jgi:hypothetical protein